MLSDRIELSRQYFEYLPFALSSNWHNLYALYQEGELTLPQKMTLLHPDHYRQNTNNVKQVLGDRTFPIEAGMQSQKCSSLFVWGYVCPITEHRGLAADHEFPYSLGGPTISSNKRFLCPLHNQMKSNDVHFFSWEQPEPEWVLDTLKRIKRYAPKAPGYWP